MERMSDTGVRRAGVLLHPTSLPGPGASGTLGNNAFYFVDWLASAGMALWQVLPLGPTHEDGSPYQCFSAHAGDPRLIDLEKLSQRGWLPANTMARVPPVKALQAAFQHWRQRCDATERQAYDHFVASNRHWLDDFALYVALREEYSGAAWTTWPASLRDREPSALAAAQRKLAERIEFAMFQQHVFFEQWHALRRYANTKNVQLFGDMPIFVAHDSADVWAKRQYFRLDEAGQPTVVAGVPPDYFSATGQRWGNPLYDWAALQRDGFSWWQERFATQLELFDLIRIDHFRGFEAYWEIDATCSTAVDGRWVKAPGDALFAALMAKFVKLPFVAEDLGVITPEVDALRRKYQFPGMKILQFAFDGGPKNPYLPHNHELSSVVYTGTHDNDTTLGWYGALTAEAKAYVHEYMGAPGEAMPWPLINAALMSVAQWAIIPLQDLMELGAEHRMNTPGTTQGNWRWRFEWHQIAPDLASQLRRSVHIYGRGS